MQLRSGQRVEWFLLFAERDSPWHRGSSAAALSLKTRPSLLQAASARAPPHSRLTKNTGKSVFVFLLHPPKQPGEFAREPRAYPKRTAVLLQPRTGHVARAGSPTVAKKVPLRLSALIAVRSAERSGTDWGTSSPRQPVSIQGFILRTLRPTADDRHESQLAVCGQCFSCSTQVRVFKFDPYWHHRSWFYLFIFNYYISHTPDYLYVCGCRRRSIAGRRWRVTWHVCVIAHVSLVGHEVLRRAERGFTPGSVRSCRLLRPQEKRRAASLRCAGGCVFLILFSFRAPQLTCDVYAELWGDNNSLYAFCPTCFSWQSTRAGAALETQPTHHRGWSFQNRFNPRWSRIQFNGNSNI